MARLFPARTAALIALACALVVCVVACGDARAPSTPMASAAAAGGTAGDGARVVIQTFQFQPTPVAVAAGTTVTWTNGDAILHTVTAGTPGAVDGRFDGPLDGTGATYAVTFAEPGTYAYFCSRHEAMRGEVRVR